MAGTDTGLCVLCEVGDFGNEESYVNYSDSLGCEIKGDAEERVEHRLYSKT